MSLFYYDLHIHSCLSPCADNDMTPQNILGMSSLKGLQIVALTDHNTAKNCGVFMKAAQEYGICAIPGMELTTAEEIHMLCLFPDLATANRFEELLEGKRIRFKNKPDIFGHQLLVDEDEKQTEGADYLLSAATMLSVDEAVPLVRDLGGFICPAHVDRPSNGMIGILGTVPTDYRFSHIEYKNSSLAEDIRQSHGLLDTVSLYDSDAHHLWDISEPCHRLELEQEHPTPSDVIRYLRNAGNLSTHS